MSHLFRDELLAPNLHFVSMDRGERELSGKRMAIPLAYLPTFVISSINVMKESLFLILRK